MKKLIVFPVLALAFVFATGAAFIDKETKTTVQELNYKYERLLQLDYARHQELMKVLKEIRELAAKKQSITVVAPRVKKEEAPTVSTAPVTPPVDVTATTAEVATPFAAPAATPAIAPVIETPAAVPASPASLEDGPSRGEATPPLPKPEIPAATTDPQATPVAAAVTNPVSSPEASPEVSKEEVPPAELAPAEPIATVAVSEPTPVTAAPPRNQEEIKVVIPEELTRQLKQSQSFSKFALFLAFLSLVSMVILIANMRKSDERLRRMVWKSEVDHLRDEVMGGRPQLKVEKSYDRLTLTNTGSVIADEIKLSLGPAPATMKQKLKVLARIEAGEKAEVEIGPQTAGGQLYGTLEYKNPDNGRIYKDQFVLKVDGVTGELIPIQQAS